MIIDKKNFYFSLLICSAIFIQKLYGQAPKNETFIKEFNWKISIPENFEKVSQEDWKKMQAKGEQAVEKTFEEDVINQTKII